MTTLKVHYEGWIALPSGLRQQLGLHSGARLEVHLVDGAIMLRPVSRASRPKQPATLSEALGSAVAIDPAPARRKPGRPRKLHTADELVPAVKRPRGRPRKAVLAVQAEPAAPSPAPASSEPWKLRKKAELQPKAAGPEPAALATRAPAPVPKDSGLAFEERRPFRNVEVRKLGPGRRRHRLQRGMDLPG